MTLVEHARRELHLLGEDPQISTVLVAAVAVFTSYSHSGFSAESARRLLDRILRWEALTPLTDDPGEWIDRTDLSGTPLWQNERDSRAFSTDGGRTFTLLGDPDRVHVPAKASMDGGRYAAGDEEPVTQPADSRSNDADIANVEEDPAGDSSGAQLVRVTVNLTRRAFDALERASELSGDSRTDTVNRAVLVYGLVQELAERGGGSITFVNAAGEKERIHIL